MTSNSFGILETDEEQESKKEKEHEKTAHPKQSGGIQEQKEMANQIQNSLKQPAKSKLVPSQEMEVEYAQTSEQPMQEQENPSQTPQNMEEDPEHLDIGELDILGLEQACKTGNFEKILEKQVDNLVEVLSQAQRKYSLGVQAGSVWDGKFQTKDNKKRGRKSTLERTIKIGEILVESGRYAKLTKYFNPNTHRSQ